MCPPFARAQHLGSNHSRILTWLHSHPVCKSVFDMIQTMLAQLRSLIVTEKRKTASQTAQTVRTFADAF
jgi:hypothetical protein